MNANRRMLFVASAACFVVGAVVCATVLLYTNPHGAPWAAGGLLVGLFVVVAAAASYLKRRAASSSLEGSRLASQSQQPPPYRPPRQTSGDYWYPAAATRDRAGTRRRGPGGDVDVAHVNSPLESSDAARQARFQREMDRARRPDGGSG